MASASGLPCSLVSSRASSSACSTIRSYQRRTSLERSLASILDHFGKARLAAAIASRVSVSPNSGTRAMMSPVALLVTGSSARRPTGRRRSTGSWQDDGGLVHEQLRLGWRPVSMLLLCRPAAHSRSSRCAGCYASRAAEFRSSANGPHCPHCCVGHRDARPSYECDQRGTGAGRSCDGQFSV